MKTQFDSCGKIIEKIDNLISVEYQRDVSKFIDGQEVKSQQSIKYTVESVSNEKMNRNMNYIKAFKNANWLCITDIDNIDHFPAPFRNKKLY